MEGSLNTPCTGSIEYFTISLGLDIVTPRIIFVVGTLRTQSDHDILYTKIKKVLGYSSPSTLVLNVIRRALR